VQLILQGESTLLADSQILAEYDEVTARPRFEFDEAERRILRDLFETIAEPVPIRPLRLTLPDPADRIFVEVAVAGAAAAIITGNTRYFGPARGALPVAVLTPRQRVERLRSAW
jgi:predicted nucleic acid-binding protein